METCCGGTEDAGYGACETVYFVTGNPHKVAEVMEIWEKRCDMMTDERIKFGMRLVHYNMDVKEIQGTPEEIVREKCIVAKRHLESVLGPRTLFSVLVEDTSLGFVALSDMPGPYIKGFSKVSPEKLHKMVETQDTTAAHASCIFAFSRHTQVGEDFEVGAPVEDKEAIELFRGQVHGRIVPPKRDLEAGIPFDWDVIFQPDGCAETFSSMGARKHSISHRRKALDAFLDYYCVHVAKALPKKCDACRP